MDKQKIIRKMKAGLLDRKLSIVHYQLSILLVVFLVVACGNSRRPGLSDKELFTQQQVNTLQQPKQELDFSDMETYIVPIGIKYTESRAVDPANPPVVFDISNRNLNIKKFNLSDYYTQVRYVKLKHPVSTTEGNFLLTDDAIFRTVKMSRERRLGDMFEGWYPQLRFTDDYIIVGDAWFGLHCYDKEGKFLYTIQSNEFPVWETDRNFFMYDPGDLKGFYGKITFNSNNFLYKLMANNKSILCLYDLTQKKQIMTRPFEGNNLFLDNNSIADYTYDPVWAIENFLFTFDLKGDTLCRFRSYHPVPEIRGGSYNSPLSPDIYYHGNRLTIRHAFNDTVFRVVSPDRLLPAYVLNFGTYRADIPTFFNGNISEKLLPHTWKEADRYILFIYTQNINSPNNRKEGSVKFFYSYYDKQSRQLYHFNERTDMPVDEYFIENPIPDAAPFLLSYADIENNQIRVCYSKKRLEALIKNKGFAALSPEQQQKLQKLHDDLEDNEVLIMILE